MTRPLTVLAPLAVGFEELELVAPVDHLRRAGCEVTVATVDGNFLVTGRNGLVLRAERTLDEVIGLPFDALLLAGGPAVMELRRDPRLPALIRRLHASGAVLGAICAAPLLLKDAEILPASFTCHDSCQAELAHAQLDQRVVTVGKIITSRGAGTAIDFGLALIAALQGPAAAERIRHEVLA
jgi:4-methyl-5(b-hydroxyethyl)-thiazole monophosphate biosynthesis